MAETENDHPPAGPLPVSDEPPRIESLDALRGLAALAVMSWHSYTALPEPLMHSLQWIIWTPYRMILASAVIFYMLSGFVLALPYFSSRPPRYRQFIAKRACRLYIPSLIVLAAAFALYTISGVGPETVNGMTFHKRDVALAASFTLPMFGQSLLSTGLWTDDLINPSTWTLVHEIRVSIVFPLLVFLCRRTRPAFFLMALCYVFVFWTNGTVGRYLIFPALTDDYVTTWLTTLYFVPCFMIGILLARFREPITRRLSRHPVWIRALLWFLVAANLWFAPDVDVKQPFTEIGVAGLLAMIISGWKVDRWLTGGLLQGLGRISYSLYLVHLPVLLCLRHELEGRASIGIVYLIYLVVTFAVALLVYRFVEKPSIELGRKWSRRLAIKAA